MDLSGVGDCEALTDVQRLNAELGALRGLSARGARLRDGDSLLFDLVDEPIQTGA
ncbi:hypothetical protein [Micromonospora sp. NPDC005237]|uniref:hypothetical protein n=1 Tax=Micromonospora sp. NPDC005237 TaxID=3155113 RepID=UPI0033AE1696